MASAREARANAENQEICYRDGRPGGAREPWLGLGAAARQKKKLGSAAAPASLSLRNTWLLPGVLET
jgi:hypothetical protein